MRYEFFSSKTVSLNEFLRSSLSSELMDFGVPSNSKIRRLIVSGSVLVNGRKILRPSFELRGRSKITVDFDEEKFFYEKKPCDIKYDVSCGDVLFEDEYIIVVNKPALFPTEKTIVGSEKRDSLHDALVRYLWKKNPDLKNPPYVGIMHRLDRETSGAILFSKQRCVNKDIQAMFENRSIRKIYLALCVIPAEKKRNDKYSVGKIFSVEKFIGRISKSSAAAKWGSLPKEQGGVYSRTDFKILEQKNVGGVECALVQAELFTGRTHQIRVHLSEMNLPILGDSLSGGKDFSRIMLHSQILEFIHPVSKKRICVDCESGF